MKTAQRLTDRRSSPRTVSAALLGFALLYASTAAVGEPAAPVPAEQLPQLLEQQGWYTQTDAEGNVFYHPPRPSPARSRHEQASGEAEPTPENVPQDIDQLLRERGWQVDTNARGDTLLVPIGRAEHAAAAPAEPVAGGTEPPRSTMPAPAPDIRQMLLERGWQVQTDAEGNTLLLPHRAAAPTVMATDEVSPAPRAATMTPREPIDAFREALEEKGWKVSTASDGTLTLFPPGVDRAAPMPPRTAAYDEMRGYCAGVQLADSGVQPPVVSEGAAAELATVWIAHFGRADYTVGRVRRVNRVFVVSIVASDAPHELRNQLVIREDASVIALY